jgi:hypothetical protein
MGPDGVRLAAAAAAAGGHAGPLGPPMGSLGPPHLSGGNMGSGNWKPPPHLLGQPPPGMPHVGRPPLPAAAAAAAAAATGLLGGSGPSGSQLQAQQSSQNLEDLLAAQGGVQAASYSRAALRELLKREYDGTGLQRRLTAADVAVSGTLLVVVYGRVVCCNHGMPVPVQGATSHTVACCCRSLGDCLIKHRAFFHGIVHSHLWLMHTAAAMLLLPACCVLPTLTTTTTMSRRRWSPWLASPATAAAAQPLPLCSGRSSRGN